MIDLQVQQFNSLLLPVPVIKRKGDDLIRILGVGYVIIVGFSIGDTPKGTGGWV